MSDFVIANSISVIYFSVAISQNRVFTIDLYSYRTVFSLLKSITTYCFFLSPAIVLPFSIVFHFSIFIYWPFSSSLFRSCRSYPSFSLSIQCPSIQTIQSWIIHKTPDLFQRLSLRLRVSLAETLMTSHLWTCLYFRGWDAYFRIDRCSNDPYFFFSSFPFSLNYYYLI